MELSLDFFSLNIETLPAVSEVPQIEIYSALGHSSEGSPPSVPHALDEKCTVLKAETFPKVRSMNTHGFCQVSAQKRHVFARFRTAET